jgi:hypothetical protein
MELKIGADPEIFIRDNKTGKLISAHGLFPGTKEEPYPVKHGAIQVDGMAAEYNIHPASTAEEFVFYHLSVLCDLRDEIKARNPDLDFSFAFVPVADFGAEYIAEQPMEAKQLGCTPDFNAWEDGQVNPTPDAEMPFRTASGHIHLGWGSDYEIDDPEHIEACCMMVKQIDSGIAPMYVLLEGEEGKRRRDLYGKAGAFRPKKYGVEYRVLSNVWLTNTFYMSHIFRAVKEQFRDLLGGYKTYDGGRAAKSRQYIDEYNEYRLEAGWGRFNPRYWSRKDNQPVTMETLDQLRAQWEVKAVNVVINNGDGLAPAPMMDHEDEFDEDDFEFDDEPDDIDEFIAADLDPQPVIAADVLGQWAAVNLGDVEPRIVGEPGVVRVVDDIGAA